MQLQYIGGQEILSDNELPQKRRKHKITTVANHFNLPQHTLENLQLMPLRRLNSNRHQRQIEERKMIARFRADTTTILNQTSDS